MKNQQQKQVTHTTWGKKLGFFLLTIAFACQTLAANLTARVNTQRVGLGEQFQLVLSTEKILGQSPDLSPLEQDFEVLGTSQSSQIQIINGKTSQSKRWIITLSAKALGKATIPAITLGSASSQPITIEVVKGSALAATHQGKITLTATLDKGTYYPFQEIPLTVRIETTVPFQQADLIAPNLANFELTQNGSDSSTQLTRNGQTVSVIERHYLLRPQKAGDFTLPPFVLRGNLQGQQRDPFDEFNQRFGDGFFNSPFGGMTSVGEPFVAKSETVTLSVKNNPNAAAGTWFLPAKAVELHAQWQPNNPTFKVGEAVTRKIRLLALGARPEQLPKLTFPDAQGVKFYVDNDETAMRETTEGTQALREISVSVVPTQGGEITLPEISVKWLNTQTNEQEIAVLPAQTLSVQGTTTTQRVVENNPPSVPKPSKDKASTEIVTSPENTSWLNIVGIVLALLVVLLAVVFWWYRHQLRLRTVKELSDNRLKNTEDYVKNIEQAIKSQNLQKIYQYLLAWQRSGVHFSEPLTRYLKQLEQQCYSPVASVTEENINLEKLLKTVHQQNTSVKNTAIKNKTLSDKQLPPLY